MIEVIEKPIEYAVYELVDNSYVLKDAFSELVQAEELLGTLAGGHIEEITSFGSQIIVKK